MAGSNKQYVYRDLDGPQAFRLFDLLPGRHDDPIRCAINHSTLISRPEFFALSYCWGATGDIEVISMNDESFSIQKNLHNFLIELRLADRPRTLWADAICINQADIEERNLQVALMKDIYTSAQSVFSWLGDHTKESVILFEFFYQIIADGTGMISQEKKADMALIFTEITGRDYWARLWIVQEVVLAKNIRVFCGNSSIPWFDLVRLYELCHDKNILPYDPSTKTRYINRNSKTKVYTGTNAFETLVSVVKQGHETMSLFEAITIEHPFKCSDIRDRVYGILGIIEDGAAWQPVVDYSLSTESLFFSILHRLQDPPELSHQILRRVMDLSSCLGVSLRRCVEVSKTLRTDWKLCVTRGDSHASDSPGTVAVETFEISMRNDKVLRKYVFNGGLSNSVCMISNIDLQALPVNRTRLKGFRSDSGKTITLVFDELRKRLIGYYCTFYQSMNIESFPAFDAFIYDDFDKDYPYFDGLYPGNKGTPDFSMPLPEFLWLVSLLDDSWQQDSTASSSSQGRTIDWQKKARDVALCRKLCTHFADFALCQKLCTHLAA